MGLMEFGVFIPIQGESIPFHSWEKEGRFTCRDNSVEIDVLLVEQEMALMGIFSHIDSGRAEKEDITANMDRMVVPDGFGFKIVLGLLRI